MHSVSKDEVKEEGVLEEDDETDARDGGWTWVICFASFVCQIVLGALSNTFGVIYVELLDYYKQGKGATAWIMSILFGVGLIGGPLYAIVRRRLGCMLTSCTGSMFIATGFAISMFSPNLYFLYFSIGLLGGVGFGMIYLVSMAVLPQYFNKHRTLATGIATSGMGVGQFLMAPLISRLVEQYTWKGAVLIEGGISLNCLVVSLLYRPSLRSSQSEQSETMQVNVTEPLEAKSKSTEVTVNGNPTFAGKGYDTEVENGALRLTKHVGQTYLVTNRISNNDEKETIPFLPQTLESGMDYDERNIQSNSEQSYNCRLKMSDDSRENTKCSEVKEVTQTLSTGVIYNMLLRNVSFVIVWVSILFSWLSYFVPFEFIVDTARDFDIETSKSDWFISMMGVANTLGRASYGVLPSLRFINRHQLYIWTMIGSGVATIVIPFSRNFWTLLCLSFLYAFLSGGAIPLSFTRLMETTDVSYQSVAVGIYTVSCGVGLSIGPAIAGWLFDITGTYLASYLFSGMCYLCAGIIFMLMPCCKNMLKQ